MKIEIVLRGRAMRTMLSGCRDGLSSRISGHAIVASAGFDAERATLYDDLILISLSAGVPGVLEKTMNSLGYEYQSEFVRRHVAQGKLEGRVEGRAERQVEIVLKLLGMRFGPLTESVQTRVRGASEAQLDSVVERVLTSSTLEEALRSLE